MILQQYNPNNYHDIKGLIASAETGLLDQGTIFLGIEARHESQV